MKNDKGSSNINSHSVQRGQRASERKEDSFMCGARRDFAGRGGRGQNQKELRACSPSKRTESRSAWRNRHGGGDREPPPLLERAGVRKVNLRATMRPGRLRASTSDTFEEIQVEEAGAQKRETVAEITGERGEN